MVMNYNIAHLLRFFVQNNSPEGAADLIRLRRIIQPDWRTSINIEDSNLNIIKALWHDEEIRDKVPNLRSLFDDEC